MHVLAQRRPLLLPAVGAVMQSVENVVARTIVDYATEPLTWRDLRNALNVAAAIVNEVDMYRTFYGDSRSRFAQ